MTATSVSREAPTFPAAELDRRFYAFTIDRLIAWTLDAVVAVAAYRLLVAEGSVLAGVAVVVATVAVVGAGFSALQGLQGYTPGKAVLGLRWSTSAAVRRSGWFLRCSGRGHRGGPHPRAHREPDGDAARARRRATGARGGISRELPPGQPTTLLAGDVVRFGDRTMTVARECLIP